MQGLQINRRLRRRGSPAKEVGGSLAELPLPLHNLVGMHVKPLGQFGQRLLATHRGQRHMGCEHRSVSPSRSFCHCLVPFIAQEGHQRSQILY